jgi:regulator of sirC expression with transglutaminase-like and TPR domain
MDIFNDRPDDYLRALGEAGEGPHDIAGAALMLAALDHPDKPRAPFIAHLSEMSEKLRADTRLVSRVEDVARTLSLLLAGQYGYEGDRLDYDDPRNANLMDVITRRRGLPVALGILYIQAARGSGFAAAGLSSPGHFLISVGFKGREALIDPFHGGAAIERERLNAPPRMRPSGSGVPRPADPVSDIEVLVRLQNNLKVRALEAGDRSRALEIARRMALLAPRRADIWLELAHLHEASGSLGAARKALEQCLALAGKGEAIHNEAALALNNLKRKLN